MRRDIGVFGAGSAVAQALSVLGFLVAARGLGPAGFGKAMAIVGVCAFLSIIVNGGLSSFLTKELATGSITQNHALRVIGQRLLVSWAFALAVVAVLGLVQVTDWLSATVYGGLLAVLTYSQAVVIPLNAARRFGAVSVIVVCDKTLFVGCAMTLFDLGDVSHGTLPLCLLIGGAAGAALAHLGYKVPLILPRVPSLSTYGASFHYSGTSILVGIQGLDVTVGAVALGSTTTGLYSGVARWGQPFSLVMASMCKVALPHMAVASDREARLHLRRLLLLSAVLGVGAGLIALLADPIVEILLGPEFAESALALRLVMGGSALAGFSQLLLTYRQSRGHPKDGHAAMWIGVIIQYLTLGIGALWIPMQALPWSMMASQAAILTTLLLLRNRK